MPASFHVSIPPASLRLTTTTLFLIRHADIDIGANPDPHLNAAGQARAQELIHVLGQTGIAEIYASQFVRTQETAQPLAMQLGLAVKIMSLVDDIVNHIKAHHVGHSVLIAGHSNTVPDIIQRFDGGQIPAIGQTEFDRLFVLTMTQLARAMIQVAPIVVSIPERSVTTVLKLQYGPST